MGSDFTVTKNLTRFKILILLFAVFLHHSPAFGEDVSFFIGFGLGSSSYKTDEGESLGLGMDQDKQRIYGSEIFEWYPIGVLGVGIRSATVTFFGEEGSKQGTTRVYYFEEDLRVSAIMPTLNLIVFYSAEKYSRLGFVGGYGIATYSYNLEVKDSESRSFYYDKSHDEDGSGSASLLGVYFDWGGDIFGMRIGFDTHDYRFSEFSVEDIPNSDEINVSGSGSAFYFNLRWAW